MGPIEEELRRAPCSSQYAAWDWVTSPDGCSFFVFSFVNDGWAPGPHNGADVISEAIEAAEAFGI